LFYCKTASEINRSIHKEIYETVKIKFETKHFGFSVSPGVNGYDAFVHKITNNYLRDLGLKKGLRIQIVNGISCTGYVHDYILHMIGRSKFPITLVFVNDVNTIEVPFKNYFTKMNKEGTFSTIICHCTYTHLHIALLL